MVYKWIKSNQTCLLCDEPSGSQAICLACEAELPWLGPHCRICAIPLPVAQQVCGECLQRRPAFTHVLSPWRFAFPIDSLIHRFKYRADWPCGRILAEQLCRHIALAYGEGLARPAWLVPVPLSRQRLRQRGFNQAQLLADRLSKPLGIPVAVQLMQRSRETVAQQQLSAQQRRQNLRQAFTLNPNINVQGQHLALIDDVLTTGATANTLAKLLIRAGAARVDVYCLARTPKPGS